MPKASTRLIPLAEWGTRLQSLQVPTSSRRYCNSQTSAGQRQSQKAMTSGQQFLLLRLLAQTPQASASGLGLWHPSGHGTHPGDCTCPGPPSAATSRKLLKCSKQVTQRFAPHSLGARSCSQTAPSPVSNFALTLQGSKVLTLWIPGHGLVRNQISWAHAPCKLAVDVTEIRAQQDRLLKIV